LNDSERAALIRQSPQAGRYDKAVDRESAYERLTTRAAASSEAQDAPPVAAGKAGGGFVDMAGELLGSAAGQALKSAARQAANQIGRELVRGLLGSLLGKKRR
jgi:hypothetical protein